ncbi:MAG TPA: hypothetical protein VFX30_12380 [bacterium]|nr:hypothetical protein [bacterium]
MKRVLPLLFAFALLSPSSALADPARTGQWIWTRGDLSLYRERLRKDPDLEAGVFVATIRAEGNGVALKRALSPALVPDPRAVVIRFDDSFHGFWEKGSDTNVASAVDRLLSGLLADVARTGSAPKEIQLDYDCPERLLPRWASVLKSLASGSLKGREVWITSLTSPLRRDDFGKLFAGTVAGHIPQVFDTGDRFSPEAATALRERLDRAALPFRLGLGAFERVSGERATGHGRWREAIPTLETSPFYRGLWVFPAGQPWNLNASKGIL